MVESLGIVALTHQSHMVHRVSLEDRILFVDGEAIVIDKPAGLAVDPPRSGGDSVTARLGELKLGFQREPVIMHRLDRDTSGCLLLARNPKAVKRFQAAFEGGEVEKTYLAAVDGIPDGTEGVIELALAKVSTAKDGWRIVPDTGGKPARTAWRLIGRQGEQALVEFRPLTGRTHQLRVHAARGLGAAIVGDPVYADTHDDPSQPMLLHAWKLRVPRGGKPPVAVTAPVPDSFGLWHDLLPGDE